MNEPLISLIGETILAAFAARPQSVQALAGGANNRVFRVTVAERKILAKAYFQHPGDRRDRLGAEFGMLGFLWKNGLRCIPEPLFADPIRQIGLYQFIEGRRLLPAEIRWPEVEQLIGLLDAMWRLRGRPGAMALPPGSDSSFSITGFLDNLTQRFRRVTEALNTGSVPSAVREYVQHELLPAMKAVCKFVTAGARDSGMGLADLLPLDQRTLTPADHGFHNALQSHAGRLTFLDFEYAGWDDPVQMICNACLQPAVPIPVSMQRRFVEQILDQMGNSAALAGRLRLLYPIFGLKWSLIMLNEYLPVSRDRRRFAGDQPENQQRRKEQLEKSQRQFKSVMDYLAAPTFFDGLVSAHA